MSTGEGQIVIEKFCERISVQPRVFKTPEIAWIKLMLVSEVRKLVFNTHGEHEDVENYNNGNYHCHHVMCL